MTNGFRTEHDSMGDVQVPITAKWQAQTQRAVENFPVSGTTMDPTLIRSLAAIKAEAARVNLELGAGGLDSEVAEAIASAADEVATGAWDEQFPIDVFQTGSGTSTNMNMNEVVATLAGEHLDGTPVHPNDHVNASQSSNDVIPTAMHVAAAIDVTFDLLPALAHLEASLRHKAQEFASVVKAGRTHLMDATPVTLGQEFGGYASQIDEAIERIASTMPRVLRLALGGTATGTGLNAPPEFAPRVIERLSARFGLPFVEAPDHFAAQGGRDALVELSGQLRTVAVSLIKIANDVRWAASGPTAGLAEIALPDLQPGSSIMPGKVNPVLCEAVTQVGAQVIGNDAAVTFAGSQGNFELNVYLPVIARNIGESIRILAAVSRLFADRCVDGIVADVERTRRFAGSSPAIATALNPHLGYEVAADVVKESVATGRTIAEVVVQRELLPQSEVDAILDVDRMAQRPAPDRSDGSAERG